MEQFIFLARNLLAEIITECDDEKKAKWISVPMTYSAPCKKLETSCLSNVKWKKWKWKPDEQTGQWSEEDVHTGQLKCTTTLWPTMFILCHGLLFYFGSSLLFLFWGVVFVCSFCFYNFWLAKMNFLWESIPGHSAKQDLFSPCLYVYWLKQESKKQSKMHR